MTNSILYNEQKTRELIYDLKPLMHQPVSLKRAKKLAKRLGCTIEGDRSSFFFWNPEFQDTVEAHLELFVPGKYMNFEKPEQHATFQYRKFPVRVEGEFAAAVLDGAPVGKKSAFGALYQIKIQYSSGEESILRDPLAASLPYGIHAPAEIYDIETMLLNRQDADYFINLSEELSAHENRRIGHPVNLLELHVQTATRQGTLHSLKERFSQIAYKIEHDRKLTPDEKNLTAFDAVELMPIDPVIEHPEHHSFWYPVQTPKTDGEELTVRLRRPSVLNWGYDVPIFGSAAMNPSLLSTGRPDELLELIEALHTFPAPIKVVLDVVYGHADNAALEVLPDAFFAGPNMYGQDLQFRHPLVRAILLEMLRRKISFGFDGVRVDGAQDFKYFDEEKEKVLHDDEFLKEMSNQKYKAAGVDYRPWMIFEDGRPWPRDDWELASTYNDVTQQQPHAFQWAPMIFAYNTPYTYTYWVSKWWRLREMFLSGEKWIGGYANHDTMRRGTQADPNSLNVNTLLGNSLKMIMENAYNNPSTTLLMHGFLPGVPMDFLQALGNTPWSFIRDTDSTYALKVVAEEAFFLDWQVTENEYRQSTFFKRLKYLGFTTLDQLKRFANMLLHLMKSFDNDSSRVAEIVNRVESETGQEWDLDKLNSYALAWMQDLNEYCNVDNHARFVSDDKARFNAEVRTFRQDNPWLSQNFKDSDFLSYQEPVDGTVIFYGYRQDPLSGKELIIVANMEGQPRQVVPADLIGLLQSNKGWNVACSTPSITRKDIHKPVRLSISQGLLFERV